MKSRSRPKSRSEQVFRLFRKRLHADPRSAGTSPPFEFHSDRRFGRARSGGLERPAVARCKTCRQKHCNFCSPAATAKWTGFPIWRGNSSATPQPGWPRAQAICDWVHNHITFGYQFARPTKTALDAYNECQGVCRDFQHLAITLCRAMHIPARYATGYLGDIGVPPGRTDGFQRMVRGLSGRPLVDVRCAQSSGRASAGS